MNDTRPSLSGFLSAVAIASMPLCQPSFQPSSSTKGVLLLLRINWLQGSKVSSTHQGWPQPGAGKQAQAQRSSARARSCGSEGSAELQGRHLHVFLQRDISGRRCSRIQSSASVEDRIGTLRRGKMQGGNTCRQSQCLLRGLGEPACTRWTCD